MEISSAAPKARFVLFLMLLVLASFGLRTISNSDFWIHLATGRTMAESGWIKTEPFSFTTAQDRVWINPAWLYDAALYRIWSAGGAAAATLAFLACILGAFILIMPLARRGASDTARSFALLLTAWLIAPTLAPGPHGFALLAIATCMRLLTNSSNRTTLLALLPLQVVWTNVHGSFLIGPALAALYCWESIRNKDNRLAVWLPIAMLGATLLNPYGLRLHSLALNSLINPNTGSLLEWISPYQADFAPFVGRHANTLLLVVIAGGFITVSGRLPLVATTLGVLGAFLLVVSPRYFLFSGLFMFPFAAYSLQGIANWISARLGNESWAAIGRGALALVGVITLLLIGSNYYFNRSGSSSTFGLGVTPDLFPEGACEALLNRPDFPERAINLAHDGGYLAWRLPHRKIFTDTRTPVYGIQFYQGLGRALMGQTETWNNLVDRFDPGAVILSGAWPGVGHATRRLIDTGQWGLAYWDGTTVVLIRRTRENARLLLDFEAQTAGLKKLSKMRREYEQQLRSRLPARNQPGLIGASHVLFSLWRFEEARALLQDITQGSPAYGLAWQNLGICLNQNGQLNEAISALKHSTRLRPDSVLSWLWLGKSYEESGNKKQAERMKQKARKLNDAIVRAFENGAGSTNVTHTLLPEDAGK